MDGSLFYSGLGALQLDEPTGALLLWEKLINQHRQSGYRPGAMVRTAEIYADKADYSSALKVYTDYSADYPDKAGDSTTKKRINELRFLLAGTSHREAELLSIIDQKGGVQSRKAREAMVELSRLAILENIGDIELAFSRLNQVARHHDLETASQAQFLLGEYYYTKGDTDKATEEFLKTLDKNPTDPDLAAQALYRAAEMMKLQGRSGEVKELVKRIEQGYPNSSWVSEGKKLLEGLR
ncbi:unnamed protein product [marine sediment metagenome]|uniref:Uncharacterized protein n=1 Tax=marine sediment metagenome TaxID=412755 RepID=X1GTT2_9ZZZZ